MVRCSLAIGLLLLLVCLLGRSAAQSYTDPGGYGKGQFGFVPLPTPLSAWIDYPLTSSEDNRIDIRVDADEDEAMVGVFGTIIVNNPSADGFLSISPWVPAYTFDRIFSTTYFLSGLNVSTRFVTRVFKDVDTRIPYFFIYTTQSISVDLVIQGYITRDPKIGYVPLYPPIRYWESGYGNPTYQPTQDNVIACDGEFIWCNESYNLQGVSWSLQAYNTVLYGKAYTQLRSDTMPSTYTDLWPTTSADTNQQTQLSGYATVATPKARDFHFRTTSNFGALTLDINGYFATRKGLVFKFLQFGDKPRFVDTRGGNPARQSGAGQFSGYQSWKLCEKEGDVAVATVYGIGTYNYGAGNQAQLVLFPFGSPQPDDMVGSATLKVRSDTRPSVVSANVVCGTSGFVSFYASNSMHVIVDIQGYFYDPTYFEKCDD